MGGTRTTPTGTAARAVAAKAYCRPTASQTISTASSPVIRQTSAATPGRSGSVQTFKDPAAYIPAAKYPMIHRAVLDACDANDGLKDGLIENPESCHVDFKALQCKTADGPDCL